MSSIAITAVVLSSIRPNAFFPRLKLVAASQHRDIASLVDDRPSRPSGNRHTGRGRQARHHAGELHPGLRSRHECERKHETAVRGRREAERPVVSRSPEARGVDHAAIERGAAHAATSDMTDRTTGPAPCVIAVSSAAASGHTTTKLAPGCVKDANTISTVHTSSTA